jgi:hypothetical protein
MVKRIAALLEGQPAAIVGLIAQYCADCRTTLSPSTPAPYTDAH